MQSGHFFRFDVEHSTNNIAIFRYLLLVDQRQYHPVYVMFDEHFVGFYANAIEHEVHNHLLFSLWLTPNASIQGDLEMDVRQIGQVTRSREFKKHSKYSTTNDLCLRPDTEGGYRFMPQFKKQQEENKKEQDNNENTITLYYQLLLIDFLFDLQHGVVFQANRQFTVVESGLKANWLTKAILAKCQYQFIKEQYVKVKKTDRPAQSKYLADRLLDAEEAWIDTITNDEATKSFENNEEWLSSRRVELRTIWLNPSEPLDKSPIRRLINGVISTFPFMPFKTTYLWWSPYKIRQQTRNRKAWFEQAINPLPKKSDNETPLTPIEKHWFRKLWTIFIDIIQSKQTIPAYRRVAKMKNKTYAFFFRHLFFGDAYQFSFYYNRTWAGLFYAVVFAAFTAIIWFWDTRYTSFFMTLGAAVFMYAIVSPLLHVVSSIFTHHTKPVYLYRDLFFPKITIGILTLWLTWIPLSEEVWVLNNKFDGSETSIFVALIMIIAVIFVYYSSKSLNPNLRGFKQLGRAILFSFFGYLIAIGWGAITVQFTKHIVMDKVQDYMPHISPYSEQLNLLGDAKDSLKGLQNNNVMADSVKFDNVFKVKLQGIIAKYPSVNIQNFCDSAQCCQSLSRDCMNGLYDYLDNQTDITQRKLITAHKNTRPDLPTITLWQASPNSHYRLYFFPRLLFVNAAIAFFLGFLAEIFIQSSSKRNDF